MGPPPIAGVRVWTLLPCTSPPGANCCPAGAGVTGPGKQLFGVKDQRLVWPVDGLAAGQNMSAEGARGEASSGMPAPEGGCQPGQERRERGRGSVPSLARAPGGSRVQSSNSSPSPRGQRRSMAPGRDLGPRPGQLGQVSRTGLAGRAGRGWGAGPAPGAESRPHLDHLLKGTVG